MKNESEAALSNYLNKMKSKEKRKCSWKIKKKKNVKNKSRHKCLNSVNIYKSYRKKMKV